MSFETVCIACNVSVPTVVPESSTTIPVLLWGQHHRTVYRYCFPIKDVECVMCGVKRKHHGSTTFKPLPQPECIEVLLREVGNFVGSLSKDSMVCAACCIFCRRALTEHDDLRPAESILQALRKKVDEKLTQCKSITDSMLRSNIALLSTAIYLGDLMLCDKAVTFPNLYQNYCSFVDVSPLPRYRILVHMGREFGNLMSSVCYNKRIGRILYCKKCDPLVMLSHALVTTTPDLDYSQENTNMSQMLRSVVDYLNGKIMHHRPFFLSFSDLGGLFYSLGTRFS